MKNLAQNCKDQLLNKLNNEGFVFLESYLESKTTLEVASMVGTVLDFEKIAPEYGVPTIQELRPRNKDSQYLHRYHGNFGLGEYPAHTDLAHWARPPRFLMLRAKAGQNQVNTHIYSRAGALTFLPDGLVKKAVFAPRKNTGIPTPLTMTIFSREAFGIRWDPLFIYPLNDAAKKCDEIIRSPEFTSNRIEVSMAHQADTLIIDNWRVMHGRSSVPIDAVSRVIERVYLEAVNG